MISMLRILDTISSRIRTWVARLCKRRRRAISRIEYVVDFPDALDRNTVYFLGGKGKEWLAGFTCPCGCGDLIELPLIGRSPKWKIKITPSNTLSISPSIHRSLGCASHFFILRGKVIWCK